MKLRALIGSLIVFGLFACSAEPGHSPMSKAAGDRTDNFISGVLTTDEGTPNNNRPVYLSKSIPSTHGDSIVYADTTFTDSSGSFSFDSLPDGEFTVYSRFDNKIALSQYTPSENNSKFNFDLTTTDGTDIYGRVLNAPDGHIYIPGTDIQAKINSVTNTYLLSGAPKGQFMLALSDSNRLSIAIMNVDTKGNYTYVEDVSISEVSDSLSYYSSTPTHKIEVIKYPADAEPLWYQGKSFDETNVCDIMSAPKQK